MTQIPKHLRSSSTMPFKSIPKALQGTIGEKGYPSQHKYHAKRSTCLYGHNHDSRKEADWCLKLHEFQKEGKIRNLILEPIYDLRVNGVVVGRHLPDFDYDIRKGNKWVPEVLDVKGIQLPEWKLKHKLFCAIYPQINYVVV